MVRINTLYDYDIKREVFKIQGDVGYVKSTDTILTQESINDSRIEYYVQTFKVKVVGDVGEGSIVIYDNDTPVPIKISNNIVNMIDWNDSMNSEVTFSVDLTYGAEHNIQARYSGNDSCLPSKSRKINLIHDLPERYSSTIIRLDNNDKYERNTSIGINLRYTSGSVFNSQNIKPLKVYVNNEYYMTRNVTVQAGASSGNTSISFSNGLDNGLYEIKIVFEGDAYNYRTELVFEISVGYKIEIEDYPFIINQEPLEIPFTFTDFFDRPVSGTLIDVRTIGLPEYTDVEVNHENFTVPSNSLRIFCPAESIPQLSSDGETLKYCASVRLGSGSQTYYSRVLTSKWFQSEVSLNSDKDIIALSKGVNLTGQVSNVSEPVIVELTGNNNFSQRITTDSNGLFSTMYVGEGAGDVTITARINGSSSSVSFEDLVQYYTSQGMNNVFDAKVEGNIVESRSGILFNTVQHYSEPISYLYFTKAMNYRNFRIDFDVVRSFPIWFWVGYYMNGGFNLIFPKSNSINLHPLNHHIPPVGSHVTVKFSKDDGSVLAWYDNDRTNLLCDNLITDWPVNFYPAIGMSTDMQNSTHVSGHEWGAIIDNIKVKVV